MSATEREDAPDSLIEAATAMRRIAWIKQLLDLHRKNAAQQEERLVKQIAFHESVLEHHGRILSRQYGKSDITLADGHCWTRKAKGTIVIENKTDCMGWAKANGYTRIKPAEEVGPTATMLREVLTETADGLVDPKTGEVVGWAKIERPPDGLTFGYAIETSSVKPEPDPAIEVI